MKASKYSLVAAVAAFILSCEKEIDYKGFDKDPVLVVNAIVKNDSVFKFNLERSYFFLSNEEPDDKYITSGATVTVTDLSNGNVYTMTQSTNGSVYEFPFTTSPNTTYKIEVSHPNYPSVSSQITTVPNIPLTDADTSTFEVEGGLKKKAVLRWNDPAGENYYLLRLFSQDVFNEIPYQMSFNCSDEVINTSQSEPFEEEPYFFELLFTDELFNGTQKELEISFYTYKGETPEENPVYTYRLITMSEEAYLYYKSVQNSQATSPFTEPVKVYNNIEGGFGIFGSLSPSEIVK